MSGNGQPNPPVLEGGVQANVQAGARNLISKILGLSQDPGVNGSFGGGDSQLPGTPARKSGMDSAMRSLKLSDFFNGLVVTPNFLFLALFIGLTAWLWVVYFVRHHEPLANDVLGVGAAHSATAEADRRLVAGIKKTFPLHTSRTTGDFYVPIPQHTGQFAASGDYGYRNAGAAAYAHPAGNMSMPLPPPPVPAPSPAPPEPTPLSYNPYAAAPQHSFVPPQHDAYLVPVQHSAGTRVKMIVNR